ncbi:hypothetical protein [Pediococcus inopinatus]|uniref:hypothetical protein n=1 Tax=Pediococcus inopinatus TaxID=114090 RepID=UPI00070FD037|nr:hypothetical protein [Pediococcus inopinatus]AVL00609.1 hypothetical protein PI20285_08155 [Pediococcus inopinatus]KRN60861.1 hypothetical protein IV83_GL001267 [Pediococcus inopinatus]WPC17071.1 hypothetical protein N6G94_07760 [Pediococcus inopinatus]WPC19808.1 hypothetical protein N6G95_01005 [Pediococcus inopinatus]
MLNKKRLIVIVLVVTISLFMNFGSVTHAATTNADNVREESIDSSERGATMKDPSFDTKITVAKTSSANTSSWSDSIEESLDKGATMKDPTSNIKITVEKAPSTNSNNKNNAQTYSKADKTKTVTNANATSKTNVDTENAIKGTSNKYITSNSSVLPQTSEKNGSSIPVIVGSLLFSVGMLWIFDYELANKYKM